MAINSVCLRTSSSEEATRHDIRFHVHSYVDLVARTKKIQAIIRNKIDSEDQVDVIIHKESVAAEHLEKLREICEETPKTLAWADPFSSGGVLKKNSRFAPN